MVLDGLIGVGIGPEDDGLWLITRFGELLTQQIGGVELGKQSGFEVKAGGELEIGVAGPGIAVDADVLG